MSVSAQSRKLVAVLTGTENGDFKRYLIDELEQRDCAVRFTSESGALVSWLCNADIVGIIIDDFNPAEITDVHELLLMLRSVRPEPIVVVLRPPASAHDLLKFEDGSIWVHGPDEAMEPCLDHVASGKRAEHVHCELPSPKLASLLTLLCL